MCGNPDCRVSLNYPLSLIIFSLLDMYAHFAKGVSLWYVGFLSLGGQCIVQCLERGNGLGKVITYGLHQCLTVGRAAPDAYF